MSGKNIKKHKGKVKLIVIALAVWIFAALLYAFIKPHSVNTKLQMGPKEVADRAYNECLDWQKKDFINKVRCYSKAFYTLSHSVSTDTAFKAIYELQKKDIVANSCHLLAHGIGRASYEKDPAHWKESVQKANLDCNYGAVHGIIEQYSAHGGKLDAKIIPTICGQNPTIGCIHSIGHVLLVQEGDNISKTEADCSSFPTKEQEQLICLRGMFMEHMTPFNLAEHGVVPYQRFEDWYKYLDDYESLCKSSSGDAEIACWREIVIPANKNFSADPQKLFDFCERAQNHDAAGGCRRYGAADLLSLHNFDLLGYKYMCTLAPSYDSSFQKDCYGILLEDTATNLPPEKMRALVTYCSSLDKDYQSFCFRKIHESFVFMKINEADIQKICSSSPAEYQKDCKKG